MSMYCTENSTWSGLLLLKLMHQCYITWMQSGCGSAEVSYGSPGWFDSDSGHLHGLFCFILYSIDPLKGSVRLVSLPIHTTRHVSIRTSGYLTRSFSVGIIYCCFPLTRCVSLHNRPFIESAKDIHIRKAGQLDYMQRLLYLCIEWGSAGISASMQLY